MNRLMALPLLLATVAGCDGNALEAIAGEGGGPEGFRVVLVDDPTQDPDPGPDEEPTFHGEFDGAIRVELRNDAGALVELGLTRDIDMLLQDESESYVLEVDRPPTDSYVAIRISFEGAAVGVAAGSVVGSRTLASAARIDVDEATLEIDVVPFTTTSDTTLEIVIDLNAELWITESNLDAGAIGEADLATNVTVEVQ